MNRTKNDINIELPMIDFNNVPLYELKDSCFFDPKEYDYWINRQYGVFFIDYQIDDDYKLMDLSKTIIAMNEINKDIPKEDLKPIKLFIHSYGGDVLQALYFCSLIKSSRIPIYTIATGAAMSAGFLIFLAGHKRFAFNYAQLLIHGGYAEVDGTPSEIESYQKNYKRLQSSIKQYILDNTSINERLFNRNKNKDWYLITDELIEYNIIDKVINDISEIME